MADVAAITGDSSYIKAIDKIWENIVGKKIYITGGIGARHAGEAFGDNYELPNLTAYNETCAAIGNVYMNYRLFLLHGDSKYFDVLERTLYNGLISGVSLDGGKFFYPNPLSCDGKYHFNADHTITRQPWFGCACCPPNLARVISSIGSYAYTENEDTLWVHLYAGGTVEKEVNGQKAQVVITSGFPWDGDVTLKVESEQPVTMTVALRIPGWCCEDFELEGAVGKECRMENGYLYVSGEWKKGDLLKLRFAMKVKVMQADSRVRQDEGKVAIMRGPVVYCLEEADNGQGLPLVRVKPDAVFTEEKTDELGFTMIMLRVNAKTKKPITVENGLYQTWQKPVYEGKELRFIPYYAWANRGEGEMEVWVNQL